MKKTNKNCIPSIFSIKANTKKLFCFFYFCENKIYLFYSVILKNLRRHGIILYLYDFSFRVHFIIKMRKKKQSKSVLREIPQENFEDLIDSKNTSYLLLLKLLKHYINCFYSYSLY